MPHRKQKRRLSLFDTSLVISALLVFILGALGWAEYYPHSKDAVVPTTFPEVFAQWSYVFFNTLRAFVFSDEYSGNLHLTTNWKILVTGWLGTYVAAGALGRAGLQLFHGPLARWKARARGGHMAVLGDGAFARQTAEALARSGHDVTHHTGLVEIEHDGVLTVPRRNSLADIFMRRSLDRANRIIVAESDQSATAETALLLSSTNPDTHVFAVFADPWLAGRIRTTRNDEKDVQATRDLLISVSESAASARSVLAKYPPFMLAKKASHKRIHALFVGFDNLGDAIVTDMLNSSLVNFLEPPTITIIDPHATARKASFLGRHPGLDQHIEFNFIDTDTAAMSEEQLTGLKKRCANDPVTVAYVAIGAKHTPLAVAIALAELGARESLFEAPIFVRARWCRACPTQRWRSVGDASVGGVRLMGRDPYGQRHSGRSP